MLFFFFVIYNICEFFFKIKKTSLTYVLLILLKMCFRQTKISVYKIVNPFSMITKKKSIQKRNKKTSKNGIKYQSL